MLSEENKITTYTFEKVWQMFAESKKEANELREQIKEMSIAADKRSAETDKIIKRLSAEADKRSAETDKILKELSAAADKRSAETDKILKENSAETERMIKENSAETERIIKENSAETNKKIKELTRNIGGVSESNGLAAEQMIYNSLEKDMKFAGIEFHYIEINKHKKIKSLNLEGEFDIVLTNCNTISLIETKHRVRRQDVIKLATEQVDNFRKLFSEYAKYNIILGIGGASFDKDAIKEAKEYGIGVIQIINDKVECWTGGIMIY
ncbi:MAG: hypothetical protein FWG85_05860 [Bacteroidetes bacterium]|nr:hypothetical protein [Bacteroidota bacterium]